MEGQSEGFYNNSGSYRGLDESTIKTKIDPTPILFEIQKKLAGGYEEFYENKEGNLQSRWRNVGKKLLNDEGIQKCMTHASSIINQATVLGFFKDTHEKTKFFLFWKKNLRKELYINKFKYGMESASDVNHVLIVISAFADLFLTRLIGRKDAEALEKIYNVHEHIEPQRNRGFNIGWK